MSTPLLDIEDLSITFGEKTAAVRGESFKIGRGETHCIVGESGCGKSVSALSIMNLLVKSARRTAKRMSFAGEDLLGMSERQMAQIRGNRMAMIFQEPMTSLNPAYTIGSQLTESYRRHKRAPQSEAVERATKLMGRVGITAPEIRLGQFPHQLSGGLRQRVMIAMALMCEPELLIADEPTTALDVTVQAQILRLLNELKDELGLSILLITHDLGVVARVADHVSVMYAGEVVEHASAAQLFADPQHPYTIGLLGSIPRIDVDRKRLATIEGTVPSPNNQPAGCRFAPRCPFADQRCRQQPPPLRDVAPGHQVACWKAPVEVAA